MNLSGTQPDEVVRWSGPCKNNLAHGPGVLTSSFGQYLNGDFREGRPFNASGRTVLGAENGEVVQAQYRDGVGTLMQLKLPKHRPTSSAPIVGQWEWTLNDGSCPQRHAYDATGWTVSSSNEEHLEEAYALLLLPGRAGVYGLLVTPVKSNQKPDCQHNLTKLGETHLNYVRFQDDGSYLTCSSMEPSSCYGRARRVGPNTASEVDTARALIAATANAPTFKPDRSRELIGQVLARQTRTIYSHYRKSLDKDPELRGQIVVDLRIAPSGRVESCRLVSSDLIEPELESQLVQLLESVDFGADESVRTTTVRWPFTFSPN